MPQWGGEPRTLTLPDWSCVELKHLDADEFAHFAIEGPVGDHVVDHVLSTGLPRRAAGRRPAAARRVGS